MLIIKIDNIDTEPLEARVAGREHVFRPAVGDFAVAAPAEIAEFGRQHDPVAAAFDRLAEQPLVVAVAIHVGGVEKNHAAVERLVDDRNAGVIVARAIDAGQRHPAEADRG